MTFLEECEIDYTEASLASLVDRIITLSVGEAEGSLLVQIDKGLSHAISDGELLFRINGREPTPEEFSIVRDDPEIQWDLSVTSLKPEIEDHVVKDLIESGIPARLLTTDDLVIFHILRKQDYDRLTGFDSAEVRKEFLKFLGTTIIEKTIGKVLGVGWATAALTARDVVGWLNRLSDLGEAFFPASRVNLNTTESDAADLIVPGEKYGLDLFFEHPVSRCLISYTEDEIERAKQDPSYRPARGCRGDVELQIDQTDAFAYEHPTILASSYPHIETFDPSTQNYLCIEEGYPLSSYEYAIRENPGILPTAGPGCVREEPHYREMKVGRLNNLEGGYYWIVPRHKVSFQPYNLSLREGETMRNILMTPGWISLTRPCAARSRRSWARRGRQRSPLMTWRA